MKIDILTLFPDMLTPFVDTSIIGRAHKAGAFEIHLHQVRKWAIDKHRTTDDTPYGGGPGMLLKVDVIDRALVELKSSQNSVISPDAQAGVPLRRDSQKKQDSSISHKLVAKSYVVLMTPQGRLFTQAIARELSQKDHLILVAGHYEGFDERVRELVDDEISIGDYVLTGGELPALVITDAVLRLLPNVLGKDASSHEESFSTLGIGNWELQAPQRLLEYPHYTRPDTFTPTSISKPKPLSVPDILKSGHHAEIEKWRLSEALKKTKKRRPELLK